MLFKGFVAAALIAVVAVPAASAQSVGARVRLSVLPLPASSLGSAAKSLRLQRGSGVISNKSFFASALPLTPNRQFVTAPLNPPGQSGRVSGYALDYGHGASGGAGVTEVWTSVDKFKTSADAKKGLDSWRRWETNRFLGSAVHGVLSVTNIKQKAAALGSARFAVLVAYSGPNIASLFGLDEQFTEGRYEADATVWAGTAQAAKQLAPKLAKKLDARVKLALAGRLRAKPVKLPPRPKAGPPPGGPDLAPLALHTTDLSGQATDLGRQYWPALFALSFYQVFMHPAGQFDHLQQEIVWYPTANEASFNDDVLADDFGPGSLDLSGLGDGAWGVLYNDPTNGGTALLFFSSGQLEESVVVDSPNTIQPSQVQSIAQTVANKINQAGLGS